MARAAGLSRAHFSREFKARLRRVPARLPADPPARAGGGAAAHHRPLGRRHLPLGRPARASAPSRPASSAPSAHPRPPTATLIPAGRRARPRPRLRGPRLRPSPTPHVSRRQAAPPRPSIAATVTSTQGENDDQDRKRTALGPRPGRGARLLHREGRHGGPVPTSPCRRWATSAGSPSARPSQEDVSIVLMAIPGPPVMDGETAEPGQRPDGEGLRRHRLPDHRRLPGQLRGAEGAAGSSSPRRPKSVPTGSTPASATRPATRIRLTEVKLPAEV